MIESRYVDGGATTTTKFHTGACRVHWLHLFPEVVATAGVVKLFDGLDGAGSPKWQMESGVVGAFHFPAPIPCNVGLHITADANVGGYTVGFEVLPPGG